MRTCNLQNEMERKMYSDQTGRFPATSFKGNQYVMLVYNIDVSKAILVKAMRNRTAGEIVWAYKAIMDRLSKGGVEPTVHLLDNECSEEYKEAISENNITFQLVPPNDHRRNAAEKAIQIFKDHFVAALCGMDASPCGCGASCCPTQRCS